MKSWRALKLRLNYPLAECWSCRRTLWVESWVIGPCQPNLSDMVVPSWKRIFFVSGLVCPPTDFWLMHVELAWCFLWWALMMGLTCNPACCFQFGQTWQMPPPPDGQKEKDVWILTLSKLLEYFSYLLCCQVLTDSQELLQSAIW